MPALMDSDDEENWSPVAAPKAKKAPVARKPKAAAAAPAPKPLGESTNNAPATGGDGRAIEDIYKKKSQLEHILLRPDTYVGSVEKLTANMWVASGERGLTQRTISYVPGLYKIFDEILVNAADNKVRDPTMSTLRVDIDQEQNLIRVYNDGAGVPVEVHKEEKVYVPELIFGHLLTSSNYDDNQKKVVGGRNGYGAKLANIFSTEFVVETADGSRQRRYRQVFTKNMSAKTTPEIKPCKSSDNWTCITFRPDLPKFNMTELEDDTVALMKKRVFDVAGTVGKGLKVYLNGDKVPIKGFKDYVELCLKDKPDVPKFYERINDRWEVCVSMSDGQFQNVSFVNSISTSKGGTHVNYIADNLANTLLEKIPKAKRGNMKAFQVKNHMFVFVNALIENPAFDSQTKENLTSRPNTFGSKAEVSDKLIAAVMKSQLIENVLSWASFKQSKELAKKDGAKRTRLTGIVKLDDANDAGGRHSQDCTLILTEGDSAKALAVAGLSVVGRDRYGVFPLRGKLLNVRDANHQQIMNNTEINHIKQILGLQHGKKYTDTKSLRYGKLMIMTDQDHDGSHIKGLLINFLHAHFPSLLHLDGFLLEFVTPIIKATKGKQRHTFYTMPEYEEWKDSLPGSTTKGWSVKYYKGLGTSTAAEAKEYFASLNVHRKTFVWEDGDDNDNLIDMAFSKKRVEARKTWMNGFTEGTYLDHQVREVRYCDFINKELILFSLADLQRSIPCLVDGFKTSQRKVLFGAFKRNLKSDIKVAQLSGYVSEHSAYHHGEASLASTIIGLAQDFVGSNNISLLFPSGQFGTRLQGGKDHASPRYIFTRLAAITRFIFPESDDKLLDYLNEDGQRIEPTHYLPVLPLVLVNGADGIGTGWSTSIPNFNPRDIVNNLKRMLAEEDVEEMQPWYKGFNGTIQQLQQTGKAALKGDSFLVTGVIRQLDDTSVEISELPLRSWTQDYKEFLEGMVKPENKNETPFILDYKEHHTDTTVSFTVKLTEAKMQEALLEGLEKKFKMTSKISTSNMHLFDAEGKITKYETVEDIMRAFYDIRLDAYGRRREMLLAHAEVELTRISNKVRFILQVVDKELDISRKKKADLEAELRSRGFDMLPKGKAAAAAAAASGREEDDADGEDAASSNANYDYLLSMPLWSLTMEKVDDLLADKEAKEQHVADLKASSAKLLWLRDLDALLEQMDVLEAEESAAASKLYRQQQVAGKGKGKGKAKKPAFSDSDEDDFEMDDDSDDEEVVPVARKRGAPAAARKPPAAAPKPAAAAAPKPPAKPAPKKKATDDDWDSDDDDIGGGSLMDRLAARAGAPAPRTSRAPAKQAPSYSGMDLSDGEDDDVASPAPAPRPAASVFDFTGDDDASPVPVPKAVPKPRGKAASDGAKVTKKRALAKKPPAVPPSPCNSEGPTPQPKKTCRKVVDSPVPRPARTARATAKAPGAYKAVVGSDSEEDEDDDVEIESESESDAESLSGDDSD